MYSTQDLRRQHDAILIMASRLGGMAQGIKTMEDALEAEAEITSINQMLVGHLTLEDEHVYPALAACGDPATAALAADCVEDMGAILGAWVDYRRTWTGAEIMRGRSRFAAATAGVIGALAMRVERENTELYPAMDGLAAARAGFRLAS